MAIGIFIGNTVGKNSRPYWTPSILVVENAEPTKVVMTGTVSNTTAVAGDFTIVGFTVISISRDATNKILTLRLTTPVLYGDNLIVVYKGKSYNVTNNVTVVFADNFTGAVIDSVKWDETDGNNIISQNGEVNELIVSQPHSANISEFTDTLISKKSVASGIAVVQSWVSWTTNANSEALGGIYLYKDANNYASITSRGTGGGILRLRIMTGGVSRYNFQTIITPAKDVKIWTDGTTIKFYYWNVNTWTQLGSDQVFSLGYPLKVAVTALDNTTFNGANPIKLDNVYMSNANYTTQYPYAKPPETLLGSLGYCWFARQKAVYNASVNKTWIGLVHDILNNGNFSNCIGIIDNSTGESTRALVGSANEFDDHNEPSILVRTSDNKLFTCYSQHGATKTIKYRISTNALDATAWGAEQTITVGATNNYLVTYPSCFEASNGDIYIFYRETVNGWAYVKSTDGGATFNPASRVLYFFGDGARGYLTFAQSPANANIIHMIGSGGHPIDITPVSLFGFYFDCSTDKLYKLDGTDVTANIPLTGADDMTVIMSNVLPNAGWMEDIIVDSSGKPRYLMTFFPNGANVNYINKELYYAEWNGSQITTPVKIHTALERNIGTDNIVVTYPPNSCFDRNNPNRIFASKNVNGVCEIFEITRVSASSFTSVQKTFGSAVDQWRPFTTKATQRNVFWLNKTSYPIYTNFDQQLVGATF